ncbi:P-loop NTPase fold protein [Streptomyces sp. NPDC050560]|uniref:P-loop NTPase fold protein n=1 Tax=Streptomyces sp. NPDC050560 TaxID=3365630 RepID=UPI00378890E7
MAEDLFTSRGPRGAHDLAIIRLPEPVGNGFPRLSDRTPELTDTLWGYGFAVRSGTRAQLWTAALTYGGLLGQALRVSGTELPDGSGGGPLVDPATGGVYGVLVARQSSGAEGLALPLTSLRDSDDPRAAALFREIRERNQAYHRGDSTAAGRGRPGGLRSYGAMRRPHALAALGSDRPSAVDLLGHGGDVDMLAMLVAAESTAPPLAIALLGEWGAGKSSTMEQMRARVAELAAGARRQGGARTAFVANVRQIRFNAWHYAEDHLWTGLVDHLFRGLAAETGEGPAVSTGEVQRRRDRLRAELERARAEAGRLQAVADAAADTAPDGRAGAVGDPLRGPRLLWAEAGTVARSAWANRGTLLVWAAVLGAAWAVWALAGSWIAAALPLAVGAGAAVGPAVRRVRAWHAALGRIAAGAGERLGRDLEEANERVAVTADRLAQVDAAVRLSEFLRRRAEEPSPYEPYRSLLSQVRRDLERLEGDLARAREEWRRRTGAGSGAPPLQRVVLYIDDLDRCSPRRVVEVLAAVHLMLALELFVVVVAVDPRWLVKALRLHHRDLFGPGPDAAGEGVEAAGAGPLDYLDKIFQIPFTIARPGEEATGRYIRSLLEAREFGLGAFEGGESGRGEFDGGGFPSSGGDRNPHRPYIAPTAPSLPERPVGPPDSPAHPMSVETDFMALLGPLLPTPRAAKKLVNLYCLVRNGVTDDDPGLFRPDRLRPLQVLLAVLVGSPAASQRMFVALAGAGDDEDVRDVLNALAEREGPGPLAAACAKTVAALARVALSTEVPNRAGAFHPWIPLVARFSFHSGAWDGE